MKEILEALRGPALGVVIMILLLGGAVVITAFAALIAQMGLLLRMRPQTELRSQQMANPTESASMVIASTRGNVTTIILWALWLVIPLGYFAMLLQQLFINPISLSTPLASAQELIERYRVRR